MDDGIQPDAPNEEYPHPDNKSARGSKGDRKAQNARYYQRHRSRLNDYKRRYMANRRRGTLTTSEA